MYRRVYFGLNQLLPTGPSPSKAGHPSVMTVEELLLAYSRDVAENKSLDTYFLVNCSEKAYYFYLLNSVSSVYSY